MVELLLERGAYLQAKCEVPEAPPLCDACGRGTLLFPILTRAGAVIVVNCAQDGDALLFAAATSGRPKMARLLLERGANKNAKGDVRTRNNFLPQR